MRLRTLIFIGTGALMLASSLSQAGILDGLIKDAAEDAVMDEVKKAATDAVIADTKDAAGKMAKEKLPAVFGDSKEEVLRRAGLPYEGEWRFVVPREWAKGQPLVVGARGGYVDRFGNEWVKLTFSRGKKAAKGVKWQEHLTDEGRSRMGRAGKDKAFVYVTPAGQLEL